MLQYLQEAKEKERSKDDASNIQYFPGSFSTFQVLSVLSRFLEWQGKKFWSKDKMGWASELGGVKGDQVGPSKAKPMPEPCSR